MQRRGFLASSASASLLAACASARSPGPMPSALTPGPPPACLPPVLVDEARVIRTLAGLRPYRDAGFVVRAEPLGQQAGATRLVHNYGHGGAGITLSWGSSRLAVDLGLADHTGPVAVLGAGVMGLSTALLAQERGHQVTIHAERLPPDTTSNIAGGQIYPASHYQPGLVSEAWMRQFAAAMDYSWRRFQLLVGEDYGIRWLPTYESGSGPVSGLLRPYMPGLADLPGTANPFPTGPVRVYNTMYVETGRYLRQLTRDFLAAGGRFVIRRFGTLAEIAALAQRVVFNCTGLGARDLVGDEGLVPKRGQLAILLPQPEIRYAYALQAGYMFPRADGVLLGGTFEIGEWEARPTLQGIAGILRKNRGLVPRSCAP